MEEKDYSKSRFTKPAVPFNFGDWYVHGPGTGIIINNHGLKLAAHALEGLEKIIFDTEKKTVSVVVKEPILPPNVPRILDLSEDTEFFEALRENIETILTTQHARFKNVIANEDRTVFTVTY